MAGVDPAELAGPGIELGDVAGDEHVVTEVGDDGVVDAGGDGAQLESPAPAVAKCRCGKGGGEGGLQPVAHRVEDGEAEKVAVERVVKAVAADVVGGLELAG